MREKKGHEELGLKRASLAGPSWPGEEWFGEGSVMVFPLVASHQFDID